MFICYSVFKNISFCLKPRSSVISPLKETQKILREENQNCSRRISNFFANNFFVVLAESQNAFIILLLQDLKALFLLLSFSLSFLSFLSSPLVLLAHT